MKKETGYKTYKDLICVRRVVRQKRGNETTFVIEEDFVNDESSAKMIVNHLIKKFHLDY